MSDSYRMSNEVEPTIRLVIERQDAKSVEKKPIAMFFGTTEYLSPPVTREARSVFTEEQLVRWIKQSFKLHGIEKFTFAYGNDGPTFKLIQRAVDEFSAETP